MIGLKAKSSFRTTHFSSAPKNIPKISRIIAPETTDTFYHLLFEKLVQVVLQGQRHVAILVVCWGCCCSLETRSNFWLTLHWWANQLYWRRREISSKAQWSRDSERSVGRKRMKRRSCKRGGRNHRQIEQVRADSQLRLYLHLALSVPGNPPLYVRATPQPTWWHLWCQRRTNHHRCYWFNPYS